MEFEEAREERELKVEDIHNVEKGRHGREDADARNEFHVVELFSRIEAEIKLEANNRQNEEDRNRDDAPNVCAFHIKNLLQDIIFRGLIQTSCTSLISGLYRWHLNRTGSCS